MRSKDKKNLLYNSLLALILCLVSIVCVLSVMLFLQTIEGQDSSQETSSSHLALTGQSQSSTSQESSKKEAESKPQELVKGSNHNQAASAYAYKAQDVRKLLYDPKASDKKIVFLTFDDGVNFEVTPKILDVLKAKKVPATFFVIGKTVGDKTRPLLERQIREGHAIGIHSYSHDYNRLFPGGVVDVKQVVKEVKETQASMQEVLGRDFHTAVWRYPGGHMSWKGTEELDASLKKLDVDWMDWNGMSGDAETPSARPTTPSDMLAYMEKSFYVAPDAKVRVILMHDASDKQLTIEALPHIIDYFKSQGYEFGVLT